MVFQMNQQPLGPNPRFSTVQGGYSNCKIVGRGGEGNQDLLFIVTKSNVTLVGGEILSFTDDSI